MNVPELLRYLGNQPGAFVIKEWHGDSQQVRVITRRDMLQELFSTGAADSYVSDSTPPAELKQIEKLLEEWLRL